MTQEEKTSKVKEIKETVSCALEIMRQIKTPGVLESFGKIMDTGIMAKGIIDALKTPEMVKNIENFRVISENINEASTKMQNTLKQLEETGIINETKGLVKSAKSTVDSVSTSKDLHEMSAALKDVFKSVKALVDGCCIYNRN
jgi:uncharacterized protein YjgD (DUF1641 family)